MVTQLPLRQGEPWTEKKPAKETKPWRAATAPMATRRHVHYWQTWDGCLDSAGEPVGKWVYARCVTGLRHGRRDCLLPVARFTPEEYRTLRELGFFITPSSTL